MHNNTLIHVGYHKTGTSWLQKEFFENPLTEINSLAKYDDRAKWITEFVKPFYLYNENNVKKLINQSYKSGKLNVLSLERLSGYPSTGGFDSLENAQRLKFLFPNAKILIVVREQLSMIRSHYMEYLKANGTEKLEELLTPERFYFIRNPIFQLEFFNYNHLIKVYDDLFSKENVLVLPFELLKTDSTCFIKSITNFLEVNHLDEFIDRLPLSKKINKQIPFRNAYLNREYSRLFGSNNSLIKITNNKYLKKLYTSIYRKLPTDYGTKLENEINNSIEKYVPVSYYKESNDVLEKRISFHCKVDLKQLGYL
jgi:hypothetical protein